jgi:DNA-binding transcriptional MocR family regulator
VSFATSKISECARLALAHDAPVVLQYGPSGGYPPLRAHIAQSLGVHESQVIIGQGSLQLLDSLIRVMLSPGDVVFIEEPTYDRTLTLFRRAGANVVGIPLQPDGPDLDLINLHLQQGVRPKLFYVIPDFQNPSGVVMSAQKRQALVDLARKYGFQIVEDSPYRLLRFHGSDLPSIFSMAPDLVIHMSSYSKLIAPGLRVGWMASPTSTMQALLKFCEDTYINPSYFNQALVLEFIQQGWLEENISILKELYRPRLEAMLASLSENMEPPAVWSKPDGGFFVSLELNKPVQVPELFTRAKQAGLILTDGRGFFASGKGDSFIRLPFCALEPAEISEGIARLAKII